MKKAIAILLVLCMCVGICLSMCACEKKDNINIEDFSAKHSVMYKQSKYVAYYCEFENGVLTVARNTYVDDPSSPSGVIKSGGETTTYSYTLNGNNEITVDGETYQYRAYKAGEYEHYVEFETPFLGLSKKWKG